MIFAILIALLVTYFLGKNTIPKSQKQQEQNLTKVTEKQKNKITEKNNTLPIELNVTKKIITTTKKEHPTVEKREKNTTLSLPKHQRISIGSSTVDIQLPTVPKAIIIKNTTSNNNNTRSIQFSKRVPPNYVPHSFDKKIQAKQEEAKRAAEEAKKQKENNNSNLATKPIESHVGEAVQNKVATYLEGAYIPKDEIEKKLKAAGFTIIAANILTDDKNLISILFTNNTLIELASAKEKAFFSTLRVLIDKKEKKISITNPIYFAKAYLQKDYDATKIKNILSAIRQHIPNLKNSSDALKFKLISKYHFMMGMPYYSDMIEVADGKNLLEKIKNKANVLFTQKVGKTSTLIGINLSAKTRKFIDKIGHNNASVLPYTILIEGDSAKILDPKYYIALTYPTLSMSQFMAISDIPDTITDECKKLFK